MPRLSRAHVLGELCDAERSFPELCETSLDVLGLCKSHHSKMLLCCRMHFPRISGRVMAVECWRSLRSRKVGRTGLARSGNGEVRLARMRILARDVLAFMTFLLSDLGVD